MKLPKILLIVSLVLIALGSGFIVAGTVLMLVSQSKLGDIFLGVSSVFGLAALAVMIYRLSIMANQSPIERENTKVIVKVVDVKDIPKSKEEQLYEQYEGLYKQGLITKEDLDKKRQELLKK